MCGAKLFSHQRRCDDVGEKVKDVFGVKRYPYHETHVNRDNRVGSTLQRVHHDLRQHGAASSSSSFVVAPTTTTKNGLCCSLWW